MSVLRRVKGQELKLGIYWEHEIYFAPIKDKNTGKTIMIPMKKKIGPFYNHVFVWTGSFWCPKTRFERWSGTPKLQQINQRYAEGNISRRKCQNSRGNQAAGLRR